MKIEHMKWVVVEGDFSEGFHLMGPFETQEEALAWVEKVGEWHLPVFITNMVSPSWVERED
jgi:hypothetical protein